MRFAGARFRGYGQRTDIHIFVHSIDPLQLKNLRIVLKYVYSLNTLKISQKYLLGCYLKE